MFNKQRKWGQFYTAPEVVDLVLGFCLRRPLDRLLDPSCGPGVFLNRAALYQRWLDSLGVGAPANTLWGVEIDPAVAAVAQKTAAARILVRDFFALQPGGELPGSFDCVVGNPPYTRSEWLVRTADGGSYKETLLQDALMEPDGAPLARLSKRSGLHAYFFVHGLKFLRPGGRFGFVVSNSWLDVDYGRGLKQFLLDHFRVLAVVESAVERWFSDARVNTCLVILERCHDPLVRACNQVCFARLQRPLREFIARPPEHPGRAVEVENLIMRLLPGRTRLEVDVREPQSNDVLVRVTPQSSLQAERKWGPYLRAPKVYFQTRGGQGMVSLGEMVDLRRGLTTGANCFFYLSTQEVAQWGIELEYTRPLLKSPKEVETIRVAPAVLRQRVLMVAQGREALAGTGALRYIEWGEKLKYHQRDTCARRSRWYSLPDWPSSSLRLAWVKGVWNRHFALLLDEDVAADQQFYLLTVAAGVQAPVEALAALLNSTWVALQAELLGRSNFGEGVLWLAGYEVGQVRLPDIRHLSSADLRPLVTALGELAGVPVCPIAEQVKQPAQQALDAVVFDLLGLPAGERAAVVESAVGLTEARIRRARGGAKGLGVQ